MEPVGEAAGVIGIERIVIGRKNKEREDLGALEWNGAWGEVFLLWRIERIAMCRKIQRIEIKFRRMLGHEKGV